MSILQNVPLVDDKVVMTITDEVEVVGHAPAGEGGEVPVLKGRG